MPKVNCAIESFPDDGLKLPKGANLRIQNGIVMIESIRNGKVTGLLQITSMQPTSMILTYDPAESLVAI